MNALLAAVALLQLQVAAETSMPASRPRGTLVATSAANVTERQVVPIGDQPLVLRGPTDSVWRVELQAAGWWMNPVDVTLTDQTVPLSIWPTATLTGAFAMTSPARFPAAVRVFAEAPPWRTHDAIRRGTEFPCGAVDAKTGQWNCEVPAAKLDLAISAAGYVPHYRWALDFAREPRIDAGTLLLRQGGSLAAWLDPDVRLNPKQPAVATLKRDVAHDASPVARDLAKPVAETIAGADGFFQLGPVDEGTYILEVAAAGFATARVFPVRIVHQRESMVRRPINLQRPLTISVAVDPAVDPSGAPWTAVVHRAADFSAGYDAKPVFRATLAEAGRAAIADQSPGRFRIAILDHLENRVAEEEADVRSASDGSLTVRLNVVHVRGTVVRRGEPLQAQLRFGGRHGVTSIAMHADAAGEFAGWVPREGEWLVDVTAADGSSATAVKVDVVDGRELTVTIPDTRIAGTVAGGRPSHADIEVVLTGSEGVVLRTTAEADGTFEIRGAAPGTYQLGARSRSSGATSAYTTVDLPDADTERTGLRLELSDLRSVTGKVVSRGRPVIGAQVHVIGATAQTREGATAMTDTQGRFSVQLSQDGSRALFIVMAPGRPLKSFEARLGSDIVLDVPESGGSLELKLPAGGAGLALFQNGVPLPLTLALHWARTQGAVANEEATLTIPNVDAALYRLCIPPLMPATRCAEGQLAPGATLRLELSP